MKRASEDDEGSASKRTRTGPFSWSTSRSAEDQNAAWNAYTQGDQEDAARGDVHEGAARGEHENVVRAEQDEARDPSTPQPGSHISMSFEGAKRISPPATTGQWFRDDTSSEHSHASAGEAEVEAPQERFLPVSGSDLFLDTMTGLYYDDQCALFYHQTPGSEIPTSLHWNNWAGVFLRVAPHLEFVPEINDWTDLTTKDDKAVEDALASKTVEEEDDSLEALLARKKAELLGLLATEGPDNDVVVDEADALARKKAELLSRLEDADPVNGDGGDDKEDEDAYEGGKFFVRDRCHVDELTQRLVDSATGMEYDERADLFYCNHQAYHWSAFARTFLLVEETAFDFLRSRGESQHFQANVDAHQQEVSTQFRQDGSNVRRYEYEDEMMAASPSSPPRKDNVPSAYFLVVYDGEGKKVDEHIIGSITDINEPRITTIGRSSKNDVVVKDPSVSARHLKIISDSAYWTHKHYIMDVGSKEGTFINNVRLSEAGVASAEREYELLEGDTVRLGHSAFMVVEKLPDHEAEARALLVKKKDSAPLPPKRTSALATTISKGFVSKNSPSPPPAPALAPAPAPARAEEQRETAERGEDGKGSRKAMALDFSSWERKPQSALADGYVDRVAIRNAAHGTGLGPSQEFVHRIEETHAKEQRQKKRRRPGARAPAGPRKGPLPAALDSSNTGYRMLAAMGWSTGSGIGRKAGRVESVSTEMQGSADKYHGRRGLGSAPAPRLGESVAAITKRRYEALED